MAGLLEKSSSRFQRSNHLDHRQCMNIVQIFSMYNRLTRFFDYQQILRMSPAHVHVYYLCGSDSGDRKSVV